MAPLRGRTLARYVSVPKRKDQNQKATDGPMELTMLQRIWLWPRLKYSCEVPLTRAAYHPPLDDGRRRKRAF